MEKPISLRGHLLEELVLEIAEILQANSLYYGHGIQSSRDEAAYLVSFYAGLPPDFDPEFNALSLQQDQIRQIEEALYKRIISRIPLAYILGKTYLSGCEFFVNEHVLIPRSPIAEVIENCFAPWWSGGQANKILDLCTGSGCLGILAAKQFEEARVDLSDVDEQALKVAKRNIIEHGLEGRVNTICSNVYDQLPDRQYDIILANPPYVPLGEQPDLPHEYLHEPGHALFAGEDGLEIAKRILQGATQHLDQGGILVLEVGQSASILQGTFSHHNFMWLELEHGGEGVCVLTYNDCSQFVE